MSMLAMKLGRKLGMMTLNFKILFDYAREKESY